MQESYIAEESANQTGEVDRAKDEQIKNLTELIEEYRAKLDAAEKALEQRPETTKPTARSEELKAQLEALKQTTQELEDGQFPLLSNVRSQMSLISTHSIERS